MKLQYKCAACGVLCKNSQDLTSHYNKIHNLTRQRLLRFILEET